MTYIKYLLPGLIFLSLIIFCKVPEGLKSGYHTEGNKIIYYSGFPATRYIVESADVSTFNAINNEYGKDKDRVFFGSKMIEGADPMTFRYLGGPYSKDKGKGYFQDKVLSEDGPNFEIIPNSDNPTAIAYAKDSRVVYKSNQILEGADPSSFVFVPMFNGNYLTYDKNNVYFNDTPIPNAEGSSFNKITGFYFKDNKRVWALLLGKDIVWVEIPEADAGSFVGIKEYYAKDKKNIFYENKIVVGADIPTFEEAKNGEAKDKNGDFSDGVRVKKKVE